MTWGMKGKRTKGKGTKRNGPKKDGAQVNGPKRKGAKGKGSKEKAAKEKGDSKRTRVEPGKENGDVDEAPQDLSLSKLVEKVLGDVGVDLLDGIRGRTVTPGPGAPSGGSVFSTASLEVGPAPPAIETPPGAPEVAVVGGGPAGIAAAIQLKRSGLQPVLFEARELGGLLRNADHVENYLGFPGGIGGGELSALLRTQLEMMGVQPRNREVLSLEKERMGFLVATASMDYTFPAVILATGTVPKQAGIPGEAELAGESIHYEVADLPTGGLGGARVLIVGGGDAAFDYALHLHKAGASPAIVFRADASRCLKLLELRVGEAGNIQVLPRTRVTDLKGISGGVEATLTEVVGETDEFQRLWTVKVNHVLIAVGREPNLKIVKGYSPSPSGPSDMEPPEWPGLFLAGDVRSARFRQASIAAGDGILAAMKAAEYLARK